MDPLIKALSVEKIKSIVLAAEEAEMPDPEEVKWRFLVELIENLEPAEKFELTLLTMIGSDKVTVAEARSKNGKLLAAAERDFLVSRLNRIEPANVLREALVKLGIDLPA
jgi:hypothetical protein